MTSTDHKAPRYVVFSTPFLPRPSRSLSTLFLNTLSLGYFLIVKNQVSHRYKTTLGCFEIYCNTILQQTNHRCLERL